MYQKKLAIVVSILVFMVSVAYSQWTPVASSPTSLIHDILEENAVLYLAHGGQGVYKSTDSTQTWQLISSGLSTPQAKNVYQLLAKEDTLYAATVDGIYKSTNGGNNWIKKSDGIVIGPGAIYEFCESIFEYNDELLTGAWSGIYRSTDKAENWIATNVTGFGISAKNFVSHSGELFAARESINFPNGYYSTDDGISWNPLTSISMPVITYLSEPGKLWAGTIVGVWLSTDSGAAWEFRSNGLASDPYSSSIIRVNDNLITSLKFGGSGVYYSTDEGLNWIDISDGLPFLNTIDKLIVYDGKIIAATSDGLWQRDTLGVITGLDEKSRISTGFKLYPNYPNPFNPTTHIRYAISSSQFVSLKVYDILGKEIATLVHEEKPAGEYTVEFFASSGDGGSSLSSGIYYYQLKAGDFRETRKLILMK